MANSVFVGPFTTPILSSLTVTGTSALQGATTTGVLYANGIIDSDPNPYQNGLVQFNVPSVAIPVGSTAGFQAAASMLAGVATSENTSDVIEGFYIDVNHVFNHNATGTALGRDFSDRPSAAAGKTVSYYQGNIMNVFLRGAGTYTLVETLELDGALDSGATQVGDWRGIQIFTPRITAGGAITGTYYHLNAEDIAGNLVTGGAQGFLNYGAGKFLVDAAGDLSMSGAYVEGFEIATPSAPAANGFRLFAKDNGSGKTQLMVIFATGAAQQVAIQP